MNTTPLTSSSSSVATLFEGDYHLGLAALANSLHSAGFRGRLFAGYRGPLPPWAAVKRSGEAVHPLTSEGPEIVFVPVETQDHLTNHKPFFLERLWDTIGRDSRQMIYFDPDVIVKCPWSFFEEWTHSGVALCEDVNSPLPSTHPRRSAWHREFTARNWSWHHPTDLYVNGGFIGLDVERRSFLQDWIRAMNIVSEKLGGLGQSQFNFGKEAAHPSRPFSKTDQDALNMAVELFPGRLALMGKEGMDFVEGGWTMSHALGAPKPWRKRYLREALKGFPPSSADKAFWAHAAHPLRVLPSAVIRRKQIELRIAAAIGRFYRRTGL